MFGPLLNALVGLHTFLYYFTFDGKVKLLQ